MEITVAGTAQVFHLIPFLLRWSTGVSPNPLQRYNIFPIHQHDCRFFSWNGTKTRNPFTKGRTVGMTAVQNAVARRCLSMTKANRFHTVNPLSASSIPKIYEYYFVLFMVI